MARGDMALDTLSIAMEPVILNRKEFEAVPQTVDFTNVDAGSDGLKVVKAGTPLNVYGVPVTSTPWSGAVGIALHDVYEDRPQVACLKKAYINVGRAQTNSGLTYDSALIKALNIDGQCRIVFEEPFMSVAYVTVSFDSDGGSAVAAQTIVKGTKATQPTAPTKTGKTFGGWYTEVALSNAFDFDTLVSADTTLYAKWSS